MTLYEFFDTGSMKTAKNEDGKTYYISAGMTYREWEKKFVKDAVSKKDVRIFNSIKTVIGNSYPKSIEEFTKIKYNNDDDEYRKLKSYTSHFISRTIGSVEQRRKGIPIKDIISAIQNPEAIHPVRHNKNGNSQRFIGKKCMVTVNPDTGILIQVDPRKRR